MTPLTCQEVRELAEAYALGLLDPDERATIEEHLAGHWHEEYASARAAVLALASAAPEADPSPALRDRILSIARAEERRRDRRWIPGFVGGAVAAAAVLLALNLSGSLDRRTAPPQQMLVQDTANGAFLEVTVEPAGTHASVRLGGLPARPGNEVYHIWLVQPGQRPQSLSVIGADRDGPWTRPVEVRFRPGDRIVVTAEPDGSRTAPSEPPVLVGQYN